MVRTIALEATGRFALKVGHESDRARNITRSLTAWRGIQHITARVRTSSVLKWLRCVLMETVMGAEDSVSNSIRFTTKFRPMP